MKKLVFTLLGLSFFALAWANEEGSAAPKAGGKEAIAVYIAGQESKESEGMHRVLGGELAKAISRNDRYSAVDRTAQVLAQLEKEHVYQRSGAVEDDQIKELGKQFAVRYLCIAEVSAVRGGMYYLDVRLVDVVTAEIAAGVTEHSTLEDGNEMIRVAQKIAGELIGKNEAAAQTAQPGQPPIEPVDMDTEPGQVSSPEHSIAPESDGAAQAKADGGSPCPQDRRPENRTRYGVRFSVSSLFAGKFSDPSGSWESETKGMFYSPGVALNTPLTKSWSLNYEITYEIRQLDLTASIQQLNNNNEYERLELDLKNPERVLSFPTTLKFEYFNFFIESGLRFDYVLGTTFDAGKIRGNVNGRADVSMDCILGAGYAFNISTVRFYPGYRMEVHWTRYDEGGYFGFSQHTFGLTALF